MLRRILRKLFIRKDPIQLARSLGVTLGEGCRLIDVTFGSEPYLVTLGNNVSATNTHFETHDGGVWVFRDKHPDWDIIDTIKVGNNVFFGKDTLVLPGTLIHDNVVIGARAVVRGELEPNCVYAGIPAVKVMSLSAYYEKCSKKKMETKLMAPLEKEYVIKRRYEC